MYYFFQPSGTINESFENFNEYDNGRFEIGNYFKTKEEAKEALEKMKIYTELKRLAERLNNGEKIDWNNHDQPKFFIRYDHQTKKFERNHNYWVHIQGVIYCLDDDFKDIAIKEIGENRLKKLFE